MRFSRLFSLVASAALLHTASLHAGPQRSYLKPGEPTIEPRIIGGTEAVPGAWPWMAALVDAASSNVYFGQFCGGTLIAPTWVVTAGHCTEGSTADEIDVVLGVHDLVNDTGERIPVKRIIQHPEYDNRTLFNDISLMELEHPSTLTPTMTHTGPSTLEGVIATIIGWGDTDPTFRDDYPETLQEVQIPIVSNAVCTSVYGADDITENMLCAGLVAGGKDSCQGDSGGPLLIPDGGGWKLAGITSWGTGCARPGYYGVYTRVANYANFIQTTLATDYFACADANSDGFITPADITKHQADGRADLLDWLSTCYRTQDSCGDVNEDSQVNRTDLILQWLDTRNDHREWLATCYTPEAS